MLSRVIIPVGAVVATVPLVSSTVKAAETTEAKVEPCDHCHTTKMVKPSDLPLYGEPAKPELVYIPEPMTPYREVVSKGRKAVWGGMEGMQGAIDATKSAYNVTAEYLKDAKARVQEDSAILQRAGLITVAGLGGVVAGYKGGVIRKAVLASASMTTAAAVCYPNQAVDISTAGLNRIKQEAMGVWEQVSGKPSEKSSPAPEKKAETPKETTNKDTTIMQENDASAPKKPAAEDPGQSRPEDQDLYASRSSK